MLEEKINLQKYAMRYGTWMGGLWTFLFILYVLGLSMPSLMLLLIPIALCVPIVSYQMICHFRRKYTSGFLAFSQAWVFLTFLWMFAALFVSVPIYVYFNFLDNGMVVNTLAQMVADIKAQKIPEYAQMIQYLEESLPLLRNLSPIDIVFNQLSQNIIIGSILALPIAAIIGHKKRLK